MLKIVENIIFERAVGKLEIYVKPSKKKTVYEKEWVCVGDVCDVFAAKDEGHDADFITRIENLKLVKTNGKKQAFLVSVLDVVKAIDAAFNGCTVVNVGEMDTLVEFSPNKKQPHAIFNWLKILFISIVLFVGSATVVMAFLTDSEMSKVFQRYHEIFLGVSTKNPYWVSVPFSIGLLVGIIGFFNHFAGRKLTNDPTPIEVQMKLYENDITDTRTAALEAMKERNEDVENP